MRTEKEEPEARPPLSSPEMTAIAYKADAAEVVARLRELYERRAGDRIFATMSVPSRTLDAFAARHPHAECAYPDSADRAAFWDDLLRERASILDDSLPSAYLSEFDQGLYGGLLGAQVRFLAHPDVGWISSMVPPLLRDWSEADGLRFDPENFWWKRYLKQLEIFVAASHGKWGISHFILIDGLNFVFELVGATRTYLSLDECPDQVQRAIDLGFDLNVRVHETFFETVPSYQGGTFSNFAQWIPGRIVSESLDPFHMTSVGYFERWGREPAERILGMFDGGVLHIHGNGRHLLQAAATIKGLKAVLLLDDRGFPLAFDVLSELRGRVGDMPLAVFADYPVFCQRLARHDLPGGVMYQVKNVPDAAAANRLMEQVRAYIA
jgi:hypothetical protein